MIVTGVKGFKRRVDEETGSGTRYTLVATYNFNFDTHDYFGHEEGNPESTLEVVLLDEDERPIKHRQNEEEKDSIKIERLDPKKFISSKPQAQEKTIHLASPPAVEREWPIRIVVQDGNQKEICSFSAKVSFEFPKEKKKDLE